MKLKSIFAACSALLGLSLTCSAAAPVFLKATSISTGGTSPAGLAAGDIDGDGHQDIIYADSGSEKVTVLINDGTGLNYTINDITLSSSNEIPDAVAVGHIFTSGTNPNAHPDIALSSSSEIHLLQNEGNGVAGVVSFQEPGDPVTSPTAYLKSFKLVDLNGDGYDDIVAIGDVYNVTDSAAELEIFINKGAAGGFEDPVIFNVGNYVSDVTVAMLRDPDIPDLVVTGLDNQGNPELIVYQNDGSGSFTETLPFQPSGFPLNTAALDLTGDGHEDLAFLEESLVHLPSGQERAILEFQYALTGTNGLPFRFSKVFPIASQTVLSGSGVTLFKTAVAIFRTPGDLGADVAVANPLQGGVVVAHFAPKLDAQKHFSSLALNPVLPTVVKTAPGTDYVVLADLNGDGRPDLVAANASANNLSVAIDKTGLPKKVTGPDYKVSIAATSGTATEQGGAITYQITYKNVGISAGHVLAVGANIPKHTTFLSGDPGVGMITFLHKSYVGMAGTPPNGLGLIYPGQSVSFSYQLKVDPATKVNTKLKVTALVAGLGGPGGTSVPVKVTVFAP